MFTPGDVLRCRARNGGFRVWQVTGVFLGGERQESVVEIQTLDWDGADANGERQERMLVPEQILELAGLEKV